MKKIKLGKTSLEVSCIGLGTINFGTKTKQDDAFALLDAYYELGGNFIDTSNNYAVWNHGDGGESERTIGVWLSKKNIRNQMVIATKVGALPKSNSTKDFSNMQGLCHDVIMQSVEQSLQNLQTDYIDLLYLHVDDFSVSQYEVMKTLHTLIETGKVKYIGCSNFYSWRIESARKICQDNGFHFFSAIQQRYSYLAPTIDYDFFPQVAMNIDLQKYLEYYQDLTLVAYSPLLKGQYNSTEITNLAYQTKQNKQRLLQLIKVKDPNIWVMKYIIDSFNGSIALLTTSNIDHLKEIILSIS